MDLQQTVETLDQHWNPTAASLYRVSRRTMEQTAHNTVIRDHLGNEFLDFACSYGVFIVGHTQPEIQAAVTAQLEQVSIGAVGVEDQQTQRLSQRLAEMLPGDLNRSYYCNSGAEASELSMRAVITAHPSSDRIVVARNSYHGKTLGALNILGQRGHRLPFGKLADNVVYVDFGDIAQMREAIAGGAAAVFIEPILGGPYLQVPQLGYLKQVESLCREYGTYLVADEIQTAFGRCGKMFGIDYDQVEPDIVILSKGLTGGHAAIAVAVFSERLDRRLRNDILVDEAFFATAGGHPYSSSAALAALDFIEQKQLVARAQKQGEYLLSEMRRVAAKYPDLVLDVPGVGLMTGLKCASPAVETAITMMMGRHNIHLGHSMNEKATHPVLRFYPPLTVSHDEVTRCITALEGVLATLGKRPKLFLKLMNALIKRQFTMPRKWLYKITGVKAA
ncbi:MULTISPECIES: aminotransferase class III-fold pyridoxal phosphate-dependent enzyme [unclassified Pseudoalteromonas]|uniref:aspartate aminotransferase family protein n=1 Tax=unclassified Pseudoalteromonas TaxID=194690 RepID=UPI0020970EC8|nr:aminotransferase class III-fold pyridoxal phosphate-dependent enzyme [Pseudoalteromonas sp. XMcav2-N]MCO7188671.1 aminotransferase class III-fold pyridoxal phosphate-dependent enzyme [Pseudoalteromonas sp. XMcav2-N]